MSPGTALDARPNPALVYDYLLGGSLSYEADRRFAARLEECYDPPEPGHLPVPSSLAVISRQFLERAVSWTAHERCRQFLDLGSGLPVSRPARPASAGRPAFPPMPSVHEVARQASKGQARVVYADLDEAVYAHGTALLAGQPGVSMIRADLADPEAVLEAAGSLPAGQAVSTRWPVCVIAAMVAYYWPPQEMRQIIAGYLDRVPPGSFLILSLAQWDPRAPEWERVRAVFGGRLFNYTLHDIADLFGGLELVPPGIQSAKAWRPGWGEGCGRAAGAWVVAGIAKKP